MTTPTWRTKGLTAVVVSTAGAGVGFGLLWCIGVASMYLTGAGYSDAVAGQWEPRFGTFIGVWYGAPVGALSAVSGYLTWLRHMPPRELLAISRQLLVATAVGALPGLLSPGVALVAVPTFLFTCARLGRRFQGTATRQAAV